jgi:hypothetical protein
MNGRDPRRGDAVAGTGVARAAAVGRAANAAGPYPRQRPSAIRHADRQQRHFRLSQSRGRQSLVDGRTPKLRR